MQKQGESEQHKYCTRKNIPIVLYLPMTLEKIVLWVQLQQLFNSR